MIPAEVLQARPGEKILDLCAAPGGKSTQIGIAMGGAGLLIANEPVPKRAAVLSRNIERMGITNAIVISAWPEQLAEKWPGAFDAVMVDAPCSGEGMFRREPETRTEWSPEKAAGCVPRQRKILEAAAKLVRPGGRMVYATCTFNPAENEGQIRGFLEDHPEYTTETFLLPGIDGQEGMYTCWPHRIRGEGQFACLMRRAGDAPAVLPDGSKDFRMDRETAGIWNEAGERPYRADAGAGDRNSRSEGDPRAAPGAASGGDPWKDPDSGPRGRGGRLPGNAGGNRTDHGGGTAVPGRRKPGGGRRGMDADDP